tara:strand:+ start:3768 stop:5186 length:1419 start_codon:yes stop_codon:yes gene_type:complete
MLFDLKASIKTNGAYPYMNESMVVEDYMTTRPTKTYDDLDYWIERTPEAVAIINAIVTDLRGDGVRFETIDKASGKQKENRANETVKKVEFFARTNFFSDELNQWLWDWIKYGDAYEWIGGVKTWIDANEKIEKFSLDIDEDFPRAMKIVPANTVDIIHDGKRITAFKQTLNITSKAPIKWDVKDIIHEKLLPNKGKVYGFSPSQASLSEMQVMGYLKDYAATFFKNGGVPDWMFILPNEMAGSPNHKRLIQMLQKYKHPVNKHGNLVFAGDVKSERLNTGLQEIDINSLAIYFTSVYALAHNMPVSRVAALIGSKVRVATGGDDLANEGYWSGINEKQDRIENVFNTQLFEPYFGVRMKINRAWKTNEIKEQQRNSIAISNLKSLNSELIRYDKQLKLDWIMRQMYISNEDLEEVNEDMKQLQMQRMEGGFQSKQPDKLERDRGAATQRFRDEKRKQQQSQQQNKPPSGIV